MRFLIALLLSLVAAVAMAADRAGQAEIDYLLGFVANSNCRFLRGGGEYDGRQAAEHLRYKLSRAGARVQTAEEFITGVASRSYLTRQPYRVRLPDGQVLQTEVWLRNALAQRRKRG